MTKLVVAPNKKFRHRLALFLRVQPGTLRKLSCSNVLRLEKRSSVDVIRLTYFKPTLINIS